MSQTPPAASRTYQTRQRIVPDRSVGGVVSVAARLSRAYDCPRDAPSASLTPAATTPMSRITTPANAITAATRKGQ